MDPINHRLGLSIFVAACVGAFLAATLAMWPASAAMPFSLPGVNVLVTVSPTPTPLPGCGLAWRRVTSPNSGNYTRLTAVAALSANDVWAVGGGMLTMHWDGSQWNMVPAPNLNGGLAAVAAVSANDVWAVGSYIPSGPPETLIIHWDGATWSVVPSPNPLPSNSLNSITVISPNDVWAAGYSYINTLIRTLTEHWDGTQWSVVPSPNASTGDNYFYGVTAVAANDVWAVGDWRIGGGLFQTLTQHWDGSAWTIVPSPNFGTSYNAFYAVAAVASNDVWAVGYAGNETLIEHWDGSTWSRTPSPIGGFGLNYLRSVAAVAPDDVWAVGYYCQSSCSSQTLNLPIIEHWDGSTWSLVPAATFPTYSNWLSGVSAISGEDVWAVGYYGETVGNNYTLTERYSDSCPPTCCPLPTATGRAYCSDQRTV